MNRNVSYHLGTLNIISLKCVHYFVSNVANRQTNKQTLPSFDEVVKWEIWEYSRLFSESKLVSDFSLMLNNVITSLAKEMMFLVALVCLFVCGQHYSKSYERIGMKLYGGVLGNTMKNLLNFGGDLGILR